MKSKFTSDISEHESLLQKYNTVFNVLGYAKLTLLLAAGVLLYQALSKGYTYMSGAAAAVAAFVILWVWHGRLHERMNYSRGIIYICKVQLDRMSGKWTGFADTGSEFIDPAHPYAGDLDIVGQKSVFQYLNSTNTWHGRQAFANDLLNPMFSRKEIEDRQKAVSELSADTAFMNKIQYYLSQIGADASAERLRRELKDFKPFLKYKALKVLLICMPVFTVLFIAGIIVLGQRKLYMAGAAAVLIQTALWVAGIPAVKKYMGSLDGLPYKLSAYGAVIDILTAREFHSEKLKEINSELLSGAQAIKDLGKLADKVNIKHNGIIYILLNVFLLWDYECALLFEGWKRKYSSSAGKWFNAIGEFESLLSFSYLPNICENVCLPEITDEKQKITARAMGHLLLPDGSRVNNDLELKNSIFIISGSNMSGKTTFLRTVGLNLVLARCGSYVCAKEMTCSILEIMSSMRVTDSLSQGISTFYAELKRIKGIIEMAGRYSGMIFLIDEIFRGTNSADRLFGAKTVLKRLEELGVIGMITTHDLELCELADNTRIKNYSFSERYENGGIHFDFKLTPGRSVTTNAKYLMEMIGII